MATPDNEHSFTSHVPQPLAGLHIKEPIVNSHLNTEVPKSIRVPFRWFASVAIAAIPIALLLVAHDPLFAKPSSHSVTPTAQTCYTQRIACVKPTTSLKSAPSISATKILQVLQHYNSPVASPEFAAQLYDLGVQYSVNPAYALAFFYFESHCGTWGLASITHSLGNIQGNDASSPVIFSLYHTATGDYRNYTSWYDGARDWFWMIQKYYFAQGLTDASSIISKYAPPDANPTEAYINTVVDLVTQQWVN